jgi:hypothetical protein
MCTLSLSNRGAVASVVLASLMSMAMPSVAGAAELYTSYPRTSSAALGTGSGTYRFAMPFTLAAPGRAQSLQVDVQATGLSGTANFALDLCADAGGVPGTILTTGTGSVGISMTTVSVTLGSQPVLSTSTTYWVLLRWTSANEVNWAVAQEVAGSSKQSQNGGAWSPSFSGGGTGMYSGRPLTLRVNGINFGAPPTAQGDSYSVNEDSTITVSAAQGVLANDADAEGNSTTAALVTPPTSGLINFAADGSFIYRPDADFNGVDSFTYRANDGASNSAAATVTIAVNAVNDGPSFTKGPNIVVDQDAPAQTLANWASGLAAGPANEASQTVAFTITFNSEPAMFSVEPAISPDGALSFTPAPGASGTAFVQARISDDGGTQNGGVDTSAEQLFQITITGVDAPPAVGCGCQAQPGGAWGAVALALIALLRVAAGRRTT